MSGFSIPTTGSALTGAEIKTAYESQPDTNAFDDTQKQRLSDAVRRRTGGGAARQVESGLGWSLVDDPSHDPWGWDSVYPVQLSGTKLRLTYAFIADEVGSFSVTPDEGFAAIGLTVGASVGKDLADITGFAPISGRISGGIGGVQYSTTSGNVVAQSVDVDAGTITVSHLAQTHTDNNGSAVKVTSAGSPDVGDFLVASQGKTGFVLQYVDDLSCRLACVDATPGAEIFAVSETNNIGISATWDAALKCVRVTYPSAGANKPNANVTISRDGGERYFFSTDTQGATTCDIFFYDVAGALITSASLNMVFHFSKPGKFPTRIPANSTFLGSVQRDMVPVNFSQLSGPSSNLWFSFAHPFTRLT